MSSPPPRWSPRSPFRAQALRFGRSLIVGSAGTGLDLAAVSLSVRVLDLSPTWARVVGLVVGCVALFYGSRSFAFQAQSGSALRQAKHFAISEAVGFPLNLLLFKGLLYLLPAMAPELLSVLANFLLFVTYYYPVRNFLVFRATPALVVQAAPPLAASAPPIPRARVVI